MAVVKKFVLPAVLMLMVSNTSVFAAGTQGHVFGKIEYVTETQRSDNDYSRSATDSFLQKYLLGYTGSIYSPRLFKYYTEAAYNIDDIKRDSNGVQYSNRVTKVSYKLRADVISGTKYPFSVYYENYNTPYWSTSPDSVSYLNEAIDRYGIRGSMGLELFNLSYSAGKSDMKTSRDFSETRQNSSDYALSIRKSFSNVNAGVSYTYRDSDTEYDDLNGSIASTDNDITKTTLANVDWLPSNVLKVNTYVSRREYLTYRHLPDQTREIDDLTAGARVSWNPTKTYRASLVASGSTFKTNDVANENSMMSITSNYKISEEFSTSQEILYFLSTREEGSDELTSMSADIRYAKTYPLDNEYTFRLSSGLRGQSYSNTSDTDDANATTYEDYFEIRYDLGAGISKYFDASATNYSFDGNYYLSYSDRYGDTARYVLSSVLSTRLNRKSTFKNRLKYTKETRNAKNSTAEYDRDTYAMYNTLNYSSRVWLKGRVKASADLSYIGGTNSRNRVYGGANGHFNYTLMRNMQFRSSASVHMEYASEITRYAASAGVNYKIRKILISFLTKYSGQIATNVDSTRMSAYLKASRRF